MTPQQMFERRAFAVLQADVFPQLKPLVEANNRRLGRVDWPESMELDWTGGPRATLCVLMESGHKIEIPFDLYPVSEWGEH